MRVDNMSSDELLASWRQAIEAGKLYAFGLSAGLLEQDNIFFNANLPSHDRPLPFKGVFDNNPRLINTTQYGFPVLDPANITGCNGKIVVLTWDYQGVKAQLLRQGLAEHRDFIRRDHFLILYNYFKHQRLYASNVVVSVTTRCTLNCADCSVMTPRQSETLTFPLHELTANADLLFRRFDFIGSLSVLGGEPLLYPQLPEYLEYLGKRHRKKMASLVLITNGTINPSPRLLDSCAKYDVRFLVSNYSGANIPGYQERLNRCMETLKSARLTADFHRLDKWYQFYTGTGESLYLPDRESELEHYRHCVQDIQCLGFHQGRLYACTAMWAAFRCGLYESDGHDYLDLAAIDPKSQKDRQKMFDMCVYFCDQGCSPHCRQCRGNDKRFHVPVPTAVQVSKASQVVMV